MTTVPAPIVLSNLPPSPFLEQTERSDMSAASFSESVPDTAGLRSSTQVSGMLTRACFSAPLDARNSRLRSAIVLPRQRMRSLGSAVTCATTVASRFSAAARPRKCSASAAETTTAMRSLALRDGKLRTVEALVLARDLIEVDVEAVGKLAYGHRDARLRRSRCSGG